MAIDVTAGKGVGTQAMNLADQRRREVFENQGITMGDLTKAGRETLGTVDTETFVRAEETEAEGDALDQFMKGQDAAIQRELESTTALTPAPVRPENMEEMARQQALAEQREDERVPSISEIAGVESFEGLKTKLGLERLNIDRSDQRAIGELNRTDPILGAFWRASNMANYVIPGSILNSVQAATLLARSYRGSDGQVVPNWDAALTAGERTKVLKSRDEKFKDAKQGDYTSEEFQTGLFGVELDVTKAPDMPIAKGSRLNTNNTNIIFHSDLLDAGLESKNKLGEPTLEIDPKFKEVMSLATEAFLMEAMFTADDADTTVSDPDETGYSSKAIKLTASKGSNRLGRDIFQAWKRQQASDLGLPTDSYLDNYEQISSNVFTHIGNMAKQFYSSVNPTMLKEGKTTPGEGLTDTFAQTEFVLTQNGIDTLTKLHKANWGLFNHQEVKPLTAPSETGLFLFEGRTRTKDITTQIPGKRTGDHKLLDEARKNANSVAMVTDQRRLSTALMFGMLGLMNAGRIENNQYVYQKATGNTGKEYAEIFKIGEKQYEAMLSEKKRLDNAAKKAEIRKQIAKAKGLRDLADAYDPAHILGLEREKMIGILEGAGRYSTTATGNAIPNYLTFARQALTGRMHAQQTIFNPQAHKIIRFIVGGKNKYQWKPGDGSTVDRNWKEGISAKLFEKKFKKTHGFKRSRDERIKIFDELAANPALDSEYNQKVQWGKSLQTLVSGFNTNQAKEQLTAFKSVRNEGEMNTLKKSMFNSMPDKDPIKDPELKRFLADEEEEAIIMADYLMDLAAYDTAKKNNTLHNSTVIFEADGITHGPSTMAMILGSTGIAKRAGVLMDQDFSQMQKSTDFMDLRDYMAEVMRKTLRENSTALGVSSKKETYEKLLELAITDRQNFLKQSPMTMGYGQEIQSLIDHVDTTIFLNQDIDKLIQEELNGDYNAASDFLHSILVDSIYQTFDPKTIDASRQVKNNAYASAMTDIDIVIDAPAGNALAILGGESVQQKYQTYFQEALYDDQFRPILNKEGRQKTKQRSVTHYETMYTPSAARPQGKGFLIPGGWTTGRLLPALVQPYDANMIARTLSGRSWEKIVAASTAQGNKDPFVLPIFDAFLVDLGSMNAVIDDANKHHIDSIIDHNYIEKVADNWYSNWKNVISKKLDTDKPLKQIIFEGSEEGYSWGEAKRGLGPFRVIAMMHNEKELAKLFQRTKKYTQEGYSLSEYDNKKRQQSKIDAQNALTLIKERGVPLEGDEITGRQLKDIIDVILIDKSGLNLEQENKTLVSETNERRKLLIEMVREQIAKGILNKNINL